MRQLLRLLAKDTQTMKALFRNVTLHEVDDEHWIVRATHLLYASEAPPAEGAKHPKWKGGASLKQQTYLEIEQKGCSDRTHEIK